MLHIYKASAGSGKTFTLAYEYIKMLLGEKRPDGSYRLNPAPRKGNHRSILAVTFTNKATEEMKRRILHELAVLADMEPEWHKSSPYMQRLCEELSASPDKVKEASALALNSLLMDFSYFNVSTIDAFFQVVLRTFAREAELMGNYELELDNDRAIEFGVNELFSWLNTDPDAPGAHRVVQWITNYLVQQFRIGKDVKLFNRSSRMHADFTKLITGISNDTFALHYDDIMHYLRQTPHKLQEFSLSLTRSIDDMLREICTGCEVALKIIGTHESCPGKVSSNLVKAFVKYAANPRGILERTASKLPLQVHENIDKAYDATRKSYFAKHGSLPDLDAAIAHACKSIVDNAVDVRLLEQIRYSLFVLGLIDKVYEFIERFREENNTILLSDTNSLLREIIGDSDAPFVYERVGLWLKHFLIDEFQDTSRMQWLNIRPLLNESMANDSDSLIIGDEKQCIYRFRDSDPTLLQCQVQEQFAGRIRVSGSASSENTNYRSAPEVVEFNNDLFARLARMTGVEGIYDNVQQQLPSRKESYPGYVSVMPLEAPTAEDFEVATLRRMADEMERQLSHGYHYDEICVLVRNRREGTPVIRWLMEIAATADTPQCEYPYLSRAGVISDDAMLLSEAPVVKTIVSTLRALTDLRFGSRSGAADEDATEVRFRSRGELADMLRRFDKFSSMGHLPADALEMALAGDASDNDTDAIPPMECFNLPSLVEYIIEQRITPQDRKQQNIYIAAFQDIVCDYCSSSTPDVGGFVKWWDASASRLTVSSPMDGRAIRVMTIHKAKGLEFKCTHIPFLNYELLKFKGHQWFESKPLPGIDPALLPPVLPMVPSGFLEQTPFAEQFNHIVREQLVDELNVLYVAFTRAGQELIATYRVGAENTVGFLLQKVCAELPRYECKECGGLVNGIPDTFPVRKTEQHTALDPHDSHDMVPYTVCDGSMVWQQTRVDFEPESVASLARGIALHNLLAMVKDTSTVATAVERAVRKHLISRSQAPEVNALVLERVTHPSTAHWFAGYKRLLRERTITDSKGNHFRADRVVWTADGHIDIIDYKFGAEHPREHAAQVRNYMRLYAEMGYTSIRGYVWYVDANEIVEVHVR